MKLILDIGNTFQKAAIFEGDNIIKTHILKKITLSFLKELFLNYKINYSILSSVICYDINIISFLKKSTYFIELNNKTPIPIVNKYKTPETLGQDRLASVVAAHYLFPASNILVIDTGTAIKYDFINIKSEYIGGSISPGLNLRLKSLHNNTGKLPLIDFKETNKLIGQNTEESILTGVFFGIVSEINGFIDIYKEKYCDLKIILSGGDYKYFEKRLNNVIFAVPNIVLTGLNKILDYNATI